MNQLRHEPTLRDVARSVVQSDEDRAAAEVERAMSRVDPEHEWCAPEYQARLNVYRDVGRFTRRIHAAQSYAAPFIADARRELAGRTLARWVQSRFPFLQP